MPTWKGRLCSECFYFVGNECRRELPPSNFARRNAEGHFPYRATDADACARFTEDEPVEQLFIIEVVHGPIEINVVCECKCKSKKVK